MEIESKLRQARIQDDIIPESTSNNITGNIRINPKNYTDAFIDNPEGGPDIYIEGSQSRNAAMDGDTVTVKLNHSSKWKLNRNIIASRWDEWSQHLMPIIERIEAEEEAERVRIVPGTSANADNLNANVLRGSFRKKRSLVNLDKSPKEKIASKLPSNLPSGISKLDVEHVISLPFSQQCIQKTGQVIEIVKRNHSGIAGGFLRPHSSEYALFSPTDYRVPRILIHITECPLDFADQASRYKNTLFVAQLTSWDGTNGFAQGNLLKIVGDCNTIQSRMETLLLENNIIDEDFPAEAYNELDYLNNLPANWFEEHSKGRRDLTDECIFTIDPKTARDLDDAVSVKQIAEQIYQVGVHIADVSYFVKELSVVDYYARLRTTSVYLVDRVIPMLPRILCEQMCSLNPGEPKLTFSVIWKMDKYGRIIDQWFGRTVIKSCTKLSYEHAQDMINNPKDISWIKEESNMPKLHAFDWKRITKSVVLLNKIAKNLRVKRFEDGALKIDQVKIKYELDPVSGFPKGFAFEERGDSNFLIEEYMLLANMAVAKRIHDHCKELAFLRRHPPSSAQLMTEVKDFCDAKGCPLDITSSGSLQRSLNAISDPTMSKVVSFLLLRAMKNAEYICLGALPKDDTAGFRHFALNVPFYTHFTSPIRRYADVIVHRMLGLALGYDSATNEDVSSLSLMANECTKRKISAKLISDTSQKLYFNLFVQKAGFCELMACVTRIYDQSFDVVLVDYDRTGRVYIERIKPHLESMKFESFSGIKRLVLDWKPVASPTKKEKKKKNKLKDQDQLDSRSNLETSRGFSTNTTYRINEAVDNRQIIEVFDVIKVIVTVDEKDISQLKIDLKTPTS